MTSHDDSSTAPKLIIGLLCSIVIIAGLVWGYFRLRNDHSQQMRALAAPSPVPEKQPIQLLIYENEPTLQGSRALLSGTLRNVSSQNLENLVIELELSPRGTSAGAGEKTSQIVMPQPTDLPTGAEAKYSLRVASKQVGAVRIVRASAKSSGAENFDLVFDVERGKARPKERPPTSLGPPNSRRNANEFLNSPDNPVALP